MVQEARPDNASLRPEAESWPASTGRVKLKFVPRPLLLAHSCPPSDSMIVGMITSPPVPPALLVKKELAAIRTIALCKTMSG
jgi:hypothetical protein